MVSETFQSYIADDGERREAVGWEHLRGIRDVAAVCYSAVCCAVLACGCSRRLVTFMYSDMSLSRITTNYGTLPNELLSF